MPRKSERYRVLRDLGRGRHATVVAAYDTRLGRTVALKQALDATAAAALRTEAQRLARVHSPHVVAIHDVLGGPPFTLVLEWLEGTTLRERMHAERLPFAQVGRWVDELFAGLAALHAADIAHGDVKPENLWVAAAGGLKLLDVGTGQDTTPLYAAPEVGDGGTPTPAADLYAAATVAWEMLSGRLPFDATDAAELVARKRTRTPPTLAAAGTTVPDAVEAWFARALAGEPAARHATAAAAASAWRDATRTDTPSAEPADLQPQATALVHTLVEAAHGHHGGAGLITGVPGSGKSTRLESGVATARAQGACAIAVRRAVAAPRRRFVDWHVAVRRAVRHHPGLPARALLVPTPTGNEIATQDRVVRTLATLAARSAVLVTCDDPTQCDAATRRLVLRLTQEAHRHGFAVVVATDTVHRGRRAMQIHAAFAASATAAVELHAPADAAWRAFVAARLGVASVSDALLAHLRARTGGNPALTIVLVRALQEAGALQRAETAWVFRPERVPDSLPVAANRILERGVAGLAAAAQRLLEIAAIHGPVFDAATLATVVATPAAEIEQTLHEIARDRGIVRRDGASWHFVPALAAEALAARLAPATRTELHRRFAAALQQWAPDRDAAIGRHLDLAGDAAAALPHLERAAHAALEAGDGHTAVTCATRACHAADAVQDSETAVARRVELGLLRAQGLHALAAWDEARAELEHSLTLARAWGLEGLEMRALRAQGRVEYACSQYDDAIARYWTAQECASRLGDGLELHELALQIGNIHFERGALDDAAAEYERCLTWAEAQGELDLGARAANNVALVESLQGRKQQAVQFFARSRERFVALGRDAAVARIEQNIGQIYLELRNWAEARNFFRRAIATSERTHEDALLAVACLDFAEATLQLGAPAEAAPAVERALAISHERGDTVGVANALRLQGLLAAAGGDAAAAEALLIDAIDKLEAVGEALHLALCWKDLGAVRLQAGRIAPARQALDEAQRRFASLDAPQHATEVETLRARCREESACRP